MIDAGLSVFAKRVKDFVFNARSTNLLIKFNFFMNQEESTTEVQTKYRVWPDGTVQSLEDREAPYSWMSDDFLIISAQSEEDAFFKAFLTK